MPFDRRAVRRFRDRASTRTGDHDFLRREIGSRLVERLDEIRPRFPLALDLGCHDGLLAGLVNGRGGIETLVQCDLSPRLATGASRGGAGLALAADEEYLPFGTGAFDLIISNLALHWVNDLPGALVQIRRSLKPDGLFLASLFGGDTLHELRWALFEGELRATGGVSPRVSPFASVRDLGGLLQRAGFALPMVDADTINVTFASPFALMRDLRAMGEANAVGERRRSLTPARVFTTAAVLYTQKFEDKDERVPATFQAIYITAWAPSPAQPQPLAPGSAKARLATALDTAEIKTGELAAPPVKPKRS